MTVILCAESNNLLPFEMTLSNFETSAFFAARWAALNRATRCSGVSPTGPALFWIGLRPVGEVGVDRRELLGDVGLEDACGVVGVKRVASETLRGAAVFAICLLYGVVLYMSQGRVKVLSEVRVGFCALKQRTTSAPSSRRFFWLLAVEHHDGLTATRSEIQLLTAPLAAVRQLAATPIYPYFLRLDYS